MTSTRKAAAIYCRISDDRTGEGLGVERQRSDCERLAKRQKLSVVGTFVDNDISAYAGKHRPEWERLIDAIKDGEVATIVCWHPDRLTRSPRELETLIDLLDAHRVDIVTVTAGEIDLATPTGRMSARIVGAVARHESEHKGTRVRAKHRERAEAGKWHGQVPYGYRRDGDGLAIVPEQAVVVRHVVGAVIEGQSLRSIVKDLSERGVPTVRGGQWTANSVRTMVRRAAIAGLREYREIGEGDDRGAARLNREPELLVKGKWEPIVDRDTWERAKAVLEDPARRVTYRRRGYLLNRLIFTDAGEPMRGWPNAKTRERGYTGPGRYIDCARCDAEVVRQMWDWLDRAGQLSAEVDPLQADPGESIEALESELRELAQQRRQGDIERVEYEVFAAGLRQRLQAARKRSGAGRVPSSVVRLLADPRRLRAEWKRWEADDAGDGLRRRREVLRHVIERVRIGPARRDGHNVAPEDRIKVKFRT